jgi:transcriptional regulator NrdR family protein
MPLYNCKLCNYNSLIKTHYNKHLKTRKHLHNVETNNNVGNENETSKKSMKMTQKDPKKTPNDPKKTQKTQEIKNEYKCEYCYKSFSTFAHKRRHELHRCKDNKDSTKIKELELKNKMLEKNHEKEKKIMYKQIESLLEKVGDTINNTTNNTTNNTINQTIVLNNYGNEDLSHITNVMLDKLIKGPCEMINNLTKLIHFNGEKPENMNIYIPNKNQKYIKVFKDNQWYLEEKKSRIPDIVDKNYNILDNYYEENKEDKLNKNEIKQYKNYQMKIDTNDSEIMTEETTKCELEILNNSKNVKDAHNILTAS